jgi:hypothetical protein
MLLRRKVEESSEKRAKENKSYITTLIKIKTIKTRKMEIKIKMGNSVGVETKTSTKTRTVIIPNSRKETRKKVEIKRRMREIRSRPWKTQNANQRRAEERTWETLSMMMRFIQELQTPEVAEDEQEEEEATSIEMDQVQEVQIEITMDSWEVIQKGATVEEEHLVKRETNDFTTMVLQEAMMTSMWDHSEVIEVEKEVEIGEEEEWCLQTDTVVEEMPILEANSMTVIPMHNLSMIITTILMTVDKNTDHKEVECMEEDLQELENTITTKHITTGIQEKAQVDLGYHHREEPLIVEDQVNIEVATEVSLETLETCQEDLH